MLELFSGKQPFGTPPPHVSRTLNFHDRREREKVEFVGQGREEGGQVSGVNTLIKKIKS